MSDGLVFTTYWLTNTYNPTRPDWAQTVHVRDGQTQTEAIANMQQWLRRFVIGEPKATDTCTVEQLQAMGMVGVYDPERLADGTASP